MITFKPKSPEQMKEWMESELQRMSAKPYGRQPSIEPQTKSTSLVEQLVTNQPSVTPELEEMTVAWEGDINPKKFVGALVSFADFYSLTDAIKALGKREMDVPENIVKNALLTIHDEPNGYISYGFEDKATRAEIDFVLYENGKNRYFPKGHTIVVENEDLYPGEGPVTVLEQREGWT